MPRHPLPLRFRRYLHCDALVQLVRQRLQQLPESRRCPTFPLADTLMAGRALYALKDPSLLAFQRRALDHNLRSVFGLHAIPCDTQMRTLVDEVEPDDLRPLFRDLFRQGQRGKVLEKFVFLQGGYLLALDGVEYFCSTQVHGDHCLTRQHNGQTYYYHQLLGAALVHPDFPEVIPLAPEPIQRADGQDQNDCERKAARRWLPHFRQDHPPLPVLITADALSSNAPHIRDLQAARCPFLLGVTPGDHASRFEQVAQRLAADPAALTGEGAACTGTRRSSLFLTDLVLKAANPDVRVHFLQCVAVTGPETHAWRWVTDLHLAAAHYGKGARGGRARWRIAKDTFNTLKNQGYHFEHNYGHGAKHLAVVLAMLMRTAFRIDQIQPCCNPLFRQAWAAQGPTCALWEALRHLFSSLEVSSMRERYAALADGDVRPVLGPLVKSAVADVATTDPS